MHKRILFFLTTAHFFIFLMTGLFRHWGYITSTNDLGAWDQAVWGFLNNEPFLNTSLLNKSINWLAVHFHPILLIFAPLYLIFSSPFWFSLAQALALSLTAWPIYILGKTVLGSEKSGLIWAIIYLVNPFLLNAGAWDFHPVSLAVPFVALGMLAVETKNNKLMGLCVFVILLCKEHLGIMVMGFGVLWWVKNRQWKFGMSLMLVGLLHFYTVLKVIMPAFSPIGHPVMLSEGLGHLSRYDWLGQSLGEIISSVIFDPYHVFKKVLFDMGGLIYLLFLLMPFLGLPLFGLLFLFPGVADLSVNMLSSISMPRSPMAYHSVTLVPIFTVAAIFGVKLIGKSNKKFSTNELSSLALTASVLIGYLLAPFPLPMANNCWAPVSFLSRPDPEIKHIRSLIGDKASISVQANIGAHFSQRKEIYQFPFGLEETDYIILRLESPTKKLLPLQPNPPLGSLSSHLQMKIPDYFSVVEELVMNDNFRIVYWNQPWLVIRKDKKDARLEKEVLTNLHWLKRKWGVENFEKKRCPERPF